MVNRVGEPPAAAAGLVELPNISVILPAHQEEGYVGACLMALADQRMAADIRPEVVVVANGCTDATAEVARRISSVLQGAGWRCQVLETPAGGKIGALNMGDAAAVAGIRVYLDADIVVGPRMIERLFRALSGPGPRYAGARLVVPAPNSRISAAYARFWQRLPFVASTATGAGLFAANAEGRTRWGAFPDVIADDGFARLNFAPHERVRVDEDYQWPISNGLALLVRVRRRQDAGNRQLQALYPALTGNSAGDRPSRRDLVRLAAGDPVGFACYALVSLCVALGPRPTTWTRGR